MDLSRAICFLDFIKKEIQLVAVQKRNYAQTGEGLETY